MRPQVLKLDDIFTSRLLSEIPQALSHLLTAALKLPSLHTIDLCDNAFGLNTQAPLVDFLKKHVPLEHLYLNNNGMGPEAGSYIANALTELAAKKKDAGAATLKTVICGRNRLETGSMEAWAKCYSVNTGVQTIKMVQNGIRQEGIVVLLKQGLSHVRSLRLLDLQDNTFTARGARSLSDIVSGWAELEELGVGDCLLSSRGGVALGEALAKSNNAKLEVLRLQYNDIDAKGVKALADAAEKLPKLRRVELNGNKFAEEDVNIERLRETLEGRKEAGETPDGVDEEEYWGLDELDELEDDDEDEEDEEADEEDEEESITKQADQAEDEKVAQDKDAKVDELADILGKTEIK